MNFFRSVVSTLGRITDCSTYIEVVRYISFPPPHLGRDLETMVAVDFMRGHKYAVNFWASAVLGNAPRTS